MLPRMEQRGPAGLGRLGDTDQKRQQTLGATGSRGTRETWGNSVPRTPRDQGDLGKAIREDGKDGLRLETMAQEWRDMKDEARVSLREYQPVIK